jgi:hypothetical protein
MYTLDLFIGVKMAERITKLSHKNLLIADRIGFDRVTDDESDTRILIWVEREGNRAYLHGATAPLVYDDMTKALRNLSRIRPDVNTFGFSKRDANF